MRILIARHGETDWNVAFKIQGKTDTDLNEHGLVQAEELCRNLKDSGYNIRRIFSSFQKRARVTAETVGKGFDIPVRVLSGLEEMNLGIFEAHSWAEVMAEFPDEYAAFAADRRHHIISGGESYQLVLERFFRALDEALSEAGVADMAAGDSDGDILLVTHGGVMMPLLALRDNLDFTVAWKRPIPNAKPVVFTRAELEAIRAKV
ncbi:MAG: histidine phosphatase family protein [Treponema sp.]|nr:histidine phosphatase family protein [Candidatus Treponema caballi]